MNAAAAARAQLARKVPPPLPPADDEATLVARPPMMPLGPPPIAAPSEARERTNPPGAVVRAPLDEPVTPAAPAPAAAPAPVPVAASVPALAAQAPAQRPATEADMRIRSAVEAAVRPLQQSVLDLQNQLAEAHRIIRERELAAGGSSANHMAARAAPMADQGIVVHVSMPPPPVLDLKAIERDTSIVIDAAFDGRARRRRMAIVFTLFLLVIFGGLFAMLARSYAPHGG